jgi:hypothetical protein
METIWSYLGYDAPIDPSDKLVEPELTDDVEVDLDVRKIQAIQKLVRAKLDREIFLTKQEAIRKIQLMVRSHQSTKLLNELKQHRHYNRKLLQKEPDLGNDFEVQYQRKVRKLIKARARCFQDIRSIDAFLEKVGESK